MIVIGLTGGIGSGKSTVLGFFKELGVATYIADIEAKKLMSSDSELIADIKMLFGDEAYTNQELNRNYISAIVFKNKEKLVALNEFVHPKVKEDFKNFLKRTKTNIVIYEAAILFESGSDKLCDYVVTVFANFEDKIARIIKRDGISKEQILERMKHQISDENKIRKSNFVINNVNLSDTKTQVRTIYNLLNKLTKECHIS